MNTTEDIHQPTRNLNRVFGLLSLLLVIYASVFSWLSWNEEKADQIHNLQNIVELGEKAIDSYFMQIERCMHELKHDFNVKDDQIDLDHAFIQAKRFIEFNPELGNVTFIRGDGQILFTAKTPPDPNLPTLASDPSFQKFREELQQQEQPFRIGKSLPDVLSKEWIIPLQYGLKNREGKLLDIISTNLPVEMLQNFWKDAPFTRTAALGLVRDDGFLVSRYPVPEKLEMDKIYGTPRTGALIDYLRQEKFPASGHVEAPNSINGQNCLHAFCRLEHFPMTLFIAMPMSEIFTDWWGNVKVPYILTAVLLLGGFVIYRRALRLEQTRETERYHASQALRESEERFRQLFEQNSASMLLIDPGTGNIIDANKSASEFYGWSIEKLRQMRIQEINTLPPEALKSEMEKAMSLDSKRLEFRHRSADGPIRDVEVFISNMEINGKVLFYSIVHDISKRKRAEAALNERSQIMQSIIDTTPDFLVLKDHDGVYKEANAAFCHFVGKRREDIIGRTDPDLFPPDEAAVYSALDAEVMRTGERNSSDRQVSGARKRSWLNITKTAFTDTTGKCVGVLSSERDISDRKRLEAETAKYEVQYRQLQKIESLNHMAGAIAHHFNNQLQAVMGNLEMAMMGDLPRDSNTMGNLTEALRAIHKATEISSMILTYRGQAPGKQTLLDLSETCRQRLTLLQAAVPKNVTLKTGFPASGPVIRANAGQIQQVLTSLLTNAWESAGENQAAVTLTVKTISWAEIPASKRFPIAWTPRETDHVCLEVADTGCGIAEKDIEKIFDPFFTTNFYGRGMGLPVVLGIVGAHGGGITVESKPDHGSIFRVFLPVSTEEIPLQQEKTVPAPNSEGGGTVLLIEDEQQVRNMTRTMLTHLGYTVLEAKDGVDAVEIFKWHLDDIRCVLSDLTMPRMDGWKTLAALRKLSPDIPVILSSGYDEAHVMAEEHTEMPDAFLEKPYRFRALSEMINRVLSNKLEQVQAEAPREM